VSLDVDAIFDALNRRDVEYILIGGMNFLLRHQPVLTFDVDVWINDTPANRGRCEAALADLGAEWGPTEAEWGPVTRLPAGWLETQRVFALTTSAGALDVFRQAPGLDSWLACRGRALLGRTRAGREFWGLSDQDMLACQYALDEPLRKLDRIRYLERLR
jgi:hypothetical protein